MKDPLIYEKEYVYFPFWLPHPFRIVLITLKVCTKLMPTGRECKLYQCMTLVNIMNGCS